MDCPSKRGYLQKDKEEEDAKISINPAPLHTTAKSKRSTSHRDKDLSFVAKISQNP